MSDIYADLAGQAEEAHEVSEDRLEALRNASTEYMELRADILRIEEELSSKKKQRLEVEQKLLPTLMHDADVDSLGMPDFGVDLNLKPYYHASIPKSWDEEKRERAFAHIEELGGSEIIRTEISVSAGKGDLEKMREAYDRMQDFFAQFEGLDPQLGMQVNAPWNTLTAFVRECVERGDAVDADRVGATIGETVKVTVRKEK